MNSIEASPALPNMDEELERIRAEHEELLKQKVIKCLSNKNVKDRVNQYSDQSVYEGKSNSKAQEIKGEISFKEVMNEYNQIDIVQALPPPDRSPPTNFMMGSEMD